MDYKEAYLLLFRGITKAIEEIEKARFVSPEAEAGVEILKASQQKAEEMYMES